MLQSISNAALLVALLLVAVLATYLLTRKARQIEAECDQDEQLLYREHGVVVPIDRHGT